jgi:hypothetical protein
MVELTRPLSTEQLTALAQDFNFLLIVRRFRPLMRWLERHPEAGTALKQGQGIPVIRSLYTALNAIDADLNRLTAGRPMAETKLPKAELFLQEEWGTLPGYFPKEIPADLVRARNVSLVLKDTAGAVLRKWTDQHFVSRYLPTPATTPETHRTDFVSGHQKGERLVGPTDAELGEIPRVAVVVIALEKQIGFAVLIHENAGMAGF